MRVCVVGATGTIGRATVAALMARGQSVTCLVRRADADLSRSATVVAANLADTGKLGEVFANGRFDAVVSCLASRTGVPTDAWDVDYRANLNVLEAAQVAGVTQFVLLSAICVQKPLLAFQHAKLAFEAELVASGLRWSIVRPTAFFKSLSGQIERVKAGRPFLIFGNGELTACKPISDGDLAAYIADCLTQEDRWNRILPIGGPGDAITPRQQGEALFAMLGKRPSFRSVPLAMLDMIAGALGLFGRVIPGLATKAELARIGRYYASESMLVLDPVTGRYDAAATPSTGSETLFDHYRAVLEGSAEVDRGDHAVF
ncbi:NAD(P)H-binding protein [Novosphingobium taihuense]|uniref:Divinyl chlorophyllide a 8-vinyl-reductase, chloroplastic n=1 Tax=Novosphingobium taihuense TaxID=260085 RepID=A0A7W7EVL2_9SPHN|nr:NAD(P)H-binding protein [Novosphingobium taihuense]MBB4613355.1 divinyl chlorophyllide a 8-vinyl-reductase [Novosphingobium taihuense]TWH85495.1 divinylchlorophyllide 8-vinylreductase [Novosphingobium taihuense]